MTETNPLLSVQSVSKWFGANQVVKDVSFTVERGESICILGPSGSGKSTLLRCINFLERADRGAIYLGGELVGEEVRNGSMLQATDQALSRQRARMGMVFQSFNLFPHLSVLDNLTVAPRHVRGASRSVTEKRAMALLDRVGLSTFADRFPSQLSGGQQQRVAIARALCMEPELLLFDEPTSALDPEMVSEVLAVIGDLVKGGMTSIIVTHEVGFAREVCDRFIFMDDGVVVEQGPSSGLSDQAVEARTRDFVSKVL